MLDKKYKKGFEKIEIKLSKGEISFEDLKIEIKKLQPLHIRIQKTILRLSKNIHNRDKVLKLCRIRDNLSIALDATI